MSIITIKFSIQITKVHRLKLNTSKILLIFNFSKVRAVIKRLLSMSLRASLTSELTIRKKIRFFRSHHGQKDG